MLYHYSTESAISLSEMNSTGHKATEVAKITTRQEISVNVTLKVNHCIEGNMKNSREQMKELQSTN